MKHFGNHGNHGNIVHPGAHQSSAEQVYMTLTRNLQMLAKDVAAINQNTNALMLKAQVIQNLLIAKGIITEAEMEVEWNKEVEKIKESMKAPIMSVDGQPLQTGAPAIETPAETVSPAATGLAAPAVEEALAPGKEVLTAPEPGHG
jgi:hypothetical protein